MSHRLDPVFASGDFVRERDSGLEGHIVRPGQYPGEWRIVTADGSETTCLAENLSIAAENPALGQSGRGVAGADQQPTRAR